jgi:hypothetical protein
VLTGSVVDLRLDGTTPTALTAVKSRHGDDPGFMDLGDVDAWQLPSGTFRQSISACGTMFLSRLWSWHLAADLRPGGQHLPKQSVHPKENCQSISQSHI